MTNYPEPFADSWFGYASEIETDVDGQTERILIERNRKIDQLQAGKKPDGWVFRFAPGVRVFAAIEPEVAKVLMGIKPELVKKAGLVDMLFGDDPKGFIGGLAFEEGASWQKSRKIITEEFNQASLDTYVSQMDDSVQNFIQKLIETDGFQSIPTISALTSQLTLEIMFKTLYGDHSFNLLELNGNHEIAHAFQTIS